MAVLSPYRKCSVAMVRRCSNAFDQNVGCGTARKVAFRCRRSEIWRAYDRVVNRAASHGIRNKEALFVVSDTP